MLTESSSPQFWSASASPRAKSRRCIASWQSPITKTGSSSRRATASSAPTPTTSAAPAAFPSDWAAARAIPSSACSAAIRAARAASGPSGEMMLTFRVLSALLSYPSPDIRTAAGEGAHILCEEKLLSDAAVAEVCGFVAWLLGSAQLDAEAAYVEAFDRGRSTSLHLFEHIHGESRERGEAMLKLLLRYRAHGLEMQAGELPDYLPLFLEFLS